MNDDVINIRIVDNKRSGLATACLVLGIVGIVGSWIPFLNVFSIVLGLVGFGLGLPAFIMYLTKKKGSLGLSIAGLLLCILTLFIAFSINFATANSLNNAFGPDEASKTEYEFGETAELEGVSIKVLDVARNDGYTKNYLSIKPTNEGDEFIIVQVEIKNNSSETKSYNVLEFSIQAGNGDIQNAGFTMYETDSNLNSGSLAAGGTKVGKIVLEAPKGDQNLMLIYSGNMLESKVRKFKLQ